MLERLPQLVRPGLLIALLSALYAVSAKLREFLSLFLHQDSGESLLPALARNSDFFGAFLAALLAAVASVLLVAAAALVACRLRPRLLEDVFPALARTSIVLLVPVLLSFAAALSLAGAPSYPYASGIAVSLALEGWFAPTLTLGLLAAAAAHALWYALGPWDDFASRSSGGRFGLTFAAVVLLSFVLFTLATPSEFYRDGAGQGNMFKYLRMAAAMAGTGTLDIERADEAPDPGLVRFLGHLPSIAGSFFHESRELFRAVLGAAGGGELYLGEMRATRANRSMFRGAAGGIYYINAPGPGILLVPAYLVDRALNRASSSKRQLAVILFWQFLGALLVYETFLAARELVGAVAAMITAFAVAVVVPILFYSFQVYPELPAALLLIFAFRKLVMDPLPSKSAVFLSGVALAFLPWLHQKYSVVAAALAIYGAFRYLRRGAGAFGFSPSRLALLAAPLLLSAYSIFLYNHALTGSLSPTATFTAAGRSSFEPAHLPSGFLGLLFDRENGLFVFAPFYLLALVGWPALAEAHPRLRKPLLFTGGSYLFVIASFPYWPGAVSTMGRYILSILPLLALPAAFAVKRSLSCGVTAGVAATLFAGSLATSASFVRDLIPSYQPMLFWDRILYCDPTQYLPSFLSPGLLGSGPAHYPKLLVELLLVAGLVYFLDRRIRERDVLPQARAARYGRGLLLGAGALVAAVVVLLTLLEHFPGNAAEAGKPRFRETLSLGGGSALWVEDGEHGFEGDGVWVAGGGETRFLLRTSEPVTRWTLSFANGPRDNVVEIEERGSDPVRLELGPDGPHARDLLLRKPYRFDGPKGERFLYTFTVRSRGSFVPKDEGRGDDERSLGTYVRVAPR